MAGGGGAAAAAKQQVSAVFTMISAYKKRRARMKAMVADAELQRARLQRARVSNAETYQTNSQRAREDAQQREINIAQAKLQADSKLASTFAGSGISGTSVNEIDDQIDTEAAQNRFQNKKQLDQNLSDQARQFSNQMNSTADQAASINTTPIKSDVFGQIATYYGATASSSGLDTNGSGGGQQSTSAPASSTNDFVGPKQQRKSYYGGVERTLGL